MDARQETKSHLLKRLFTAVASYGYEVRKNEVDGLQAWNDIKKKFSDETGKCEWRISRQINDGQISNDFDQLYNYVHDVLGMVGGDEDGDTVSKYRWERYHFFLQLIRIPRNNRECSLVRLMQVAYNVGQLRAEYNHPVYEEGREFYRVNRLGCLDSYIDVVSANFGTEVELKDLIDDIEARVEKIDRGTVSSDEMTGGSYKYLKYKSKYLQARR